jgi:hypothetical protein
VRIHDFLKEKRLQQAVTHHLQTPQTPLNQPVDMGPSTTSTHLRAMHALGKGPGPTGEHTPGAGEHTEHKAQSRGQGTGEHIAGGRDRAHRRGQGSTQSTKQGAGGRGAHSRGQGTGGHIAGGREAHAPPRAHGPGHLIQGRLHATAQTQHRMGLRDAILLQGLGDTGGRRLWGTQHTAQQGSGRVRSGGTWVTRASGSGVGEEWMIEGQGGGGGGSVTLAEGEVSK